MSRWDGVREALNNHKAATVGGALGVVTCVANLIYQRAHNGDAVHDLRGLPHVDNTAELALVYAALTAAGSALTAAAGEGLARTAERVSGMWAPKNAPSTSERDALLNPDNTRASQGSASGAAAAGAAAGASISVPFLAPGAPGANL